MEKKGKKSDVRMMRWLVFVIETVYLLLSFYTGTHVSISRKEMVDIREELIRYEISKSHEEFWEFSLDSDEKTSIKDEAIEYDDMLIYRYKDGSYLVTNKRDEALLFASCFDTNPTKIPKGMTQALKENFIPIFAIAVTALLYCGLLKKEEECKNIPKDADEEKRGMEFYEIKEELEKKKEDEIPGKEENVGEEEEKP